VQPEVQAVQQGGGLDVGSRLGRRPRRRQALRNAHLRRRRRGPECLHRQPVRQQQVVHHREQPEAEFEPRRVHAQGVPEHRMLEGFVVRDPARHPVTDPPHDELHDIGETLCGGAVQPTSLVLQRLRQIPVVQRRQRLDAAREQAVDQPFIEVQPGFVCRPSPRRLYARPGDREAIGADAKVSEQREVFIEAVVVVAGDLGRLAARDAARCRAEAIPDGRPAPPLGQRAFDLESRGRHAPEESRGEVLHAWLFLNMIIDQNIL
jgi:hypothetical protein